MPARSPHHSTKQAQCGATLIICLVILTILTLLAVGSMSVTNLETSMVRNNQLSLVAYNHSLSEINAQIGIINDNKNTSMLNDALNSDALSPDTRQPHRLLAADEKVMTRVQYGAMSIEQEVIIDYLGQGLPPGSSEYVVQAHRFDIHSKSTLAGAGGTSNQTQGIYFIAPR
jgi:hypothetical protein